VQRCLTRIPSSRPTVAELKAQYNPPRQAHAISVSAHEPPVVDAASAPENPPPARKSSNEGMLGLGVAVAIVILVAAWISWPVFHRHARAERSSGDISRAESRKGSAVNTSATGTAPGDARVTSDDIAVGTTGNSTLATAGDAPVRTAPVEAPVTPADRPIGAAGDAAGESAGGPSDASAGGPSRAPSGASAGAPTTAPLAARGITRASPSAASVVGSPAIPSAPATLPALASGSVLHQEIPEVPRTILGKIRGHVNVAVRVLVDPSGNVVGEFFENAGPSRYFSRLAGDAAGAWTFAPTDARGSGFGCCGLSLPGGGHC